MMLTQDEVIALANKAGMQVINDSKLGRDDYHSVMTSLPGLVRFAQACYEAGAKAENEACESAINALDDEYGGEDMSPYWCANEIRERRK